MNKAVVVFMWLVIASLSIFIHLKLYPYGEDDAYIHFRIAKNFVDYGKPYFNEEERVNASSSICWTFLISLVFKLISQNIRVIAVLNALITTCGAFFFTRLLKEEVIPERIHPLFYMVFTALYFTVTSTASIGLMDTPLALCLLGGSLLLLLKKKPAGFVLLGFMIFTRLEYTVLLIGFIVYFIIKKSFSLKQIILWLLTGILPFIILSLIYWGTIIPHSFIAKQVVFYLPSREVVSLAIETLFPSPPQFTGKHMIPGLLKFIYFNLLFLVITIIFVYKKYIEKSITNRPGIACVMSAGAFIIICGYIFKNVLIVNWYIPLYTILLVFVVFKIILLNKKAIRFLLVALTLPWCLSLLNNLCPVFFAAVKDEPVFYKTFEEGARVRKYLSLGKILYDHFPDASLMTSEIGGLGYYFKGHIYDGVGLVSPDALQFHPMKIPGERSNGTLGAIPVRYIEQVKPDIIVSYDIFIEDFLRSTIVNDYLRKVEPIFLDSDYRKSRTKQIWGSRSLYVFIKRDYAALHNYTRDFLSD